MNPKSFAVATALLFAGGLTVCGVAGATGITDAYTATYTVSNNGTPAGLMTRTLKANADGTYVLESNLTATEGLMALVGIKVLERSIWTLDGDTIKPLDYLYQQSGLHSRKITMHFDWEHKRIDANVKGEARQLEAVPGMYDNILYQVAISRDLKAGKKALDYVVAESGKIKKYHIEQTGTEKLDTPLGTLGSKRQTTLWCAPSLNYLPVRMDHIEKNGEQTSAKIKSYSPASEATTGGTSAPPSSGP